jgi:hypothetical protein
MKFMAFLMCVIGLALVHPWVAAAQSPATNGPCAAVHAAGPEDDLPPGTLTAAREEAVRRMDAQCLIEVGERQIAERDGRGEATIGMAVPMAPGIYDVQCRAAMARAFAVARTGASAAGDEPMPCPDADGVATTLAMACLGAEHRAWLPYAGQAAMVLADHCADDGSLVATAAALYTAVPTTTDELRALHDYSLPGRLHDARLWQRLRGDGPRTLDGTTHALFPRVRNFLERTAPDASLRRAPPVLLAARRLLEYDVLVLRETRGDPGPLLRDVRFLAERGWLHEPEVEPVMLAAPVHLGFGASRDSRAAAGLETLRQHACAGSTTEAHMACFRVTVTAVDLGAQRPVCERARALFEAVEQFMTPRLCTYSLAAYQEHVTMAVRRGRDLASQCPTGGDRMFREFERIRDAVEHGVCPAPQQAEFR